MGTDQLIGLRVCILTFNPPENVPQRDVRYSSAFGTENEAVNRANLERGN